MRAQILNLVLFFSFLASGSYAADCLNFTELVKKARADVAAGAKVKSTFVDLNFKDAEPDQKWLQEYGGDVSSIQTDWLTDSKSPIPEQVGCERVKNMGDLEMVIARYTKEEIELRLDGDMFIRKMAQSLAKTMVEKPVAEIEALEAPKAPRPPRAVVPKPNETQEEAFSRTVLEELGEVLGDAIGDALAEAFGELLKDPQIQAQIAEKLLETATVSGKDFKAEIEERIRFTIRHDEPNKITVRIKNSYGDGDETRAFETTHIIRWGKGELPEDKVSAKAEAFLRAVADAKKAVAAPALP